MLAADVYLIAGLIASIPESLHLFDEGQMARGPGIGEGGPEI